MKTTAFPEISPAFTVEDIRKIRNWNSERYAGMTRRDIVDDINDGAREFMVLIENSRQTKRQENPFATHDIAKPTKNTRAVSMSRKTL